MCRLARHMDRTKVPRIRYLIDEGSEEHGGDQENPADLKRHLAVGVAHAWRVVTTLITLTPSKRSRTGPGTSSPNMPYELVRGVGIWVAARPQSGRRSPQPPRLHPIRSPDAKQPPGCAKETPEAVAR